LSDGVIGAPVGADCARGGKYHCFESGFAGKVGQFSHAEACGRLAKELRTKEVKNFASFPVAYIFALLSIKTVKAIEASSRDSERKKP
jgi:hypothetical protein